MTDRLESGECWNGQLTDIGKLRLQKSGENLRQLYVNSLGFMPRMLDQDSSKLLRIRSTEYARTIESTQFLLTGLYPSAYRNGQEDLPIIIEPKDETMYPSSSPGRCKSLLQMPWHSRTNFVMLLFPGCCPCTMTLAIE